MFADTILSMLGDRDFPLRHINTSYNNITKEDLIFFQHIKCVTLWGKWVNFALPLVHEHLILFSNNSYDSIINMLWLFLFYD